MQHYIPYTPQWNRVAKRKNRSLKEMYTCMMASNTFPPNFWAEAINCDSYIKNKVPHNQINEFTPFEYWSGHTPNVSHLRIFDSREWARIPLDKRRDLKPQSQE